MTTGLLASRIDLINSVAAIGKSLFQIESGCWLEITQSFLSGSMEQVGDVVSA